MGLTYKDLYSNKHENKLLRENLYKEKTNVLSYYVIKTVMMNNYPAFLEWCDKNNYSLFAFKKTIANQRNFCEFIGKNYKIRTMLENIHNTELFLQYLKKNNRDAGNSDSAKDMVMNSKMRHLLLTNLRMTICELG